MRTTVRLSDDLLRLARKKAAEQRRTLTSPALTTPHEYLFSDTIQLCGSAYLSFMAGRERF
jgi:hypothetical protein